MASHRWPERPGKGAQEVIRRSYVHSVAIMLRLPAPSVACLSSTASPCMGDNSAPMTGIHLMHLRTLCWSRSPVAGLAPDRSSMIHGRPPGSLDRMQMLEGNGALKELVGDHGECVHVHLHLSSGVSRSRWGAIHRCLEESWTKPAEPPVRQGDGQGDKNTTASLLVGNVGPLAAEQIPTFVL